MARTAKKSELGREPFRRLSDSEILLFVTRTLQPQLDDADAPNVFAKLQSLKDVLRQQEMTLPDWPDCAGKDRMRDALAAGRGPDRANHRRFGRRGQAGLRRRRGEIRMSPAALTWRARQPRVHPPAGFVPAGFCFDQLPDRRRPAVHAPPGAIDAARLRQPRGLRIRKRRRSARACAQHDAEHHHHRSDHARFERASIHQDAESAQRADQPDSDHRAVRLSDQDRDAGGERVRGGRAVGQAGFAEGALRAHLAHRAAQESGNPPTAFVQNQRRRAELHKKKTGDTALI